MMKLVVISATVGAACAFAPSAHLSTSTTSVRHMSTEPEAEIVVEEQALQVDAATIGDAATAIAAPVAINGWVADSTKPCFGLPGAISPIGFFDPLGFTNDLELSEVKRYREAEIMHGRVAMMATVGYLIGESTPTIAYGFDIPHTIANNQIPEIPGTVLFPFFLAINISEAYRASRGWVEPGLGPLFSLRDNYYPGDLGFDPLSLKPASADDFANMQAKELSNGRLAMLAVAGMCVQEQINGQGILENLGF